VHVVAHEAETTYESCYEEGRYPTRFGHLFFQNETEEDEKEYVASYVEDASVKEYGCENSPREYGCWSITLD